MSNGDEPRDTRPRRLIYEMREQAHHARGQFYGDGVESMKRRETKQNLVFAVLQYWDALYEFQEESVLDEGDFPDITPILQRIGEQKAVITQQSGRKRGETVEYVPAVTELDEDYLFRTTKQLDRAAKKLGFGASARESGPDMFGVDPEWEESEA